MYVHVRACTCVLYIVTTEHSCSGTTVVILTLGPSLTPQPSLRCPPPAVRSSVRTTSCVCSTSRASRCAAVPAPSTASVSPGDARCVEETASSTSLAASYRYVSSRLVSSRLVSSRLVSSRLVSSRLVSSRLVSSRLVSSRLVSSRANSRHLHFISRDLSLLISLVSCHLSSLTSRLVSSRGICYYLAEHG